MYNDPMSAKIFIQVQNFAKMGFSCFFFFYFIQTVSLIIKIAETKIEDRAISIYENRPYTFFTVYKSKFII